MTLMICDAFWFTCSFDFLDFFFRPRTLSALLSSSKLFSRYFNERDIKIFCISMVNQIIHTDSYGFCLNDASRWMSHKTRMSTIHHNSKWFIQILPNLPRSLPRLKTNPVNVEAQEENSNQLLQVRRIQKQKRINPKVKAWVRYHNE